jgi:hypothetical protein
MVTSLLFYQDGLETIGLIGAVIDNPHVNVRFLPEGLADDYTWLRPGGDMSRNV